MKIRLFQYPLPAPPELEDLNEFLEREKATSVTHHVVQSLGKGPMLLVIVESAAQGKAAPAAVKKPFPSSTEPKIDYQTVLSPEAFSVFSDLRELRKVIATREGIPLYSVFSNANLAEMVTSRVTVPKQMENLSGIAEGKVKKYGADFLKVLGEAFPNGNQEKDSPK